MWEQGKPIGQGKKIYPDGRAKEGYWENGAFVEQGGIGKIKMQFNKFRRGFKKFWRNRRI